MKKEPSQNELSNEELAKLSQLICTTIPRLKEAIDFSIYLRKKGHEEYVTRTWEEFFGEFLQYIRKRSREEGEDLLNEVSFSRVFSGNRSR